jgi:LmbE family N-acetylglucosaminyl deacetylase
MHFAPTLGADLHRLVIHVLPAPESHTADLALILIQRHTLNLPAQLVAYYTADGMPAQALVHHADTYGHIYLSPHLDDVVLSCGGRIWQQVQAGERVLAVTVFGGAPAPGAPLSPFAQELHARWGHLADAAARRQEEDLAALALLGAEGVHWPYTDCIYRQTPDGRFPYASEEALWGEVHPAEKDLIAELGARMAALPARPTGMAYVPLGVGHHVDHQIVRRAAEASGHTLTCYEEFPYAEDPRAVQAALAQGRWRAELVLLSEEALEARTAAIACYRSQLSTFWTDVTDMAAAVRAFAERPGSGSRAERYWILDA